MRRRYIEYVISHEVYCQCRMLRQCAGSIHRHRPAIVLEREAKPTEEGAASGRVAGSTFPQRRLRRQRSDKEYSSPRQMHYATMYSPVPYFPPRAKYTCYETMYILEATAVGNRLQVARSWSRVIQVAWIRPRPTQADSRSKFKMAADHECSHLLREVLWNLIWDFAVSTLSLRWEVVLVK